MGFSRKCVWSVKIWKSLIPENWKPRDSALTSFQNNGQTHKIKWKANEKCMLKNGYYIWACFFFVHLKSSKCAIKC